MLRRTRIVDALLIHERARDLGRLAERRIVAGCNNALMNVAFHARVVRSAVSVVRLYDPAPPVRQLPHTPRQGRDMIISKAIGEAPRMPPNHGAPPATRATRRPQPASGVP